MGVVMQAQEFGSGGFGLFGSSLRSRLRHRDGNLGRGDGGSSLIRRWLGLRRRRVQAVFEQGANVTLHLLQLVELQGRVDDGEYVACAGSFIDEHAMSVARDLLFDLEQTFALEHDGENIRGRNVAWVVQLDQLAQEGLGILPLNRINRGRRRSIDAMPIGDEAFAVARALAVLLLPAGLANVRAPEIGFL